MKARLLLLVGALAGCSGRMVLATDPPGAEVYIGSTRAGKTPLGLNEAELAKAKTANGYMVRVEKPGFTRVLVLLPSGYRGVQVDLNLKPFAATATAVTASGAPDQTVFGAERMSKLYSDSATLLTMQSDLMEDKELDLDVLKKLKNDYPDSGSPLLLEGLSLYAKGDAAGAANALREAVRRNPQEAEFHAIMKEIEPAAPPSDTTPDTQSEDPVTTE